MGRVALVTSVLAVWSFTISYFPNFLGIVLGGLFSVPAVLLFLQAFPEKQPRRPWMIVLFILALAIPVIALLGALKVRRRIKNYNKLSQPGGELRAIRTEEAIIDALEDFTLKPPVPEREDTFYPENEESEFDREYRKEQLEKIEAEAEDDRAEAFCDIDCD